MNDEKRKLVIIGIDGGTFDIIDPLIKDYNLPNIKKIIDSGVKGILKSTYPPITAAAWVSFMTGKNPGKHSFFDFREYNLTEYTPTYIPKISDSVKDDISTLHSSNFRNETIWDFFSNAGYEINVIAVPMTYPSWKINGRMLSGFPSPDYKNPNTYPAEWGKEIGSLINISSINYENIDEFIKECSELVHKLGDIILKQIKEKKGEVFAVVFNSSDFAQHYFWQFLDNPQHKYSSIIKNIYIEIDKIIGEVLNYICDDTSVLILSDHGFMKHPKKYFNLNAWLVQEGYISLNKKTSSDLNIFSKIFDLFLNQIRYKKNKWRRVIKEKISKMPFFIRKWASEQYFKSNIIDWNNTKAFRFKMYSTVEGIVINQKNRQKNGIVEQGDEYNKIRDEIIEKLLKLKDPLTGEKIAIEIFKREDLYKGNYMEKAPDIIVNLNPNYLGGLEIDGTIVNDVGDEIKQYYSGIHNHNGIFVYKSPNIKKSSEIIKLDIIDVIPTLLYDFDLPISKEIDGKIKQDIFNEAYIKTTNPRYSDITKKDNEKENITDEDKELMKKALKGLGYLD